MQQRHIQSYTGLVRTHSVTTFTGIARSFGDLKKNKLNNNLEDKNANDESRNIILILCQTHRLVYITDLYS